mgnify:FL=1
MRRNQKGFLIVLCLCMLSVSGVIGVYQYRKGQNQEAEPETPQQSAQTEETQETGPEKEAANSEGTVAQADTEENLDEAKIETEEDIYEIGEAELAQAEETEEDAASEETEETAVQSEEAEEEPSEEEEADTSETEQFAFADDSRLIWPVDGDVILNYSMDKSIYFSTLNQYKYHPAIVISAEVGSEVRCAARGEVTDISVNEETGTTLTMDIGSGYQAIYGQLKEVTVEEGDTVESGTVIGYVSEPTKYYTLEGSNLYFQLLKNREPVNPMDYME